MGLLATLAAGIITFLSGNAYMLLFDDQPVSNQHVQNKNIVIVSDVVNTHNKLMYAATIAAGLYGIKRLYNSYKTIKIENKAPATTGAVCKKTGSLLFDDLRWFLNCLMLRNVLNKNDRTSI